MFKHRYINTHFWKDNYIINLDPTEKLIYLYLLTNPLTNIAGVYEINIKEISIDAFAQDNNDGILVIAFNEKEIKYKNEMGKWETKKEYFIKYAFDLLNKEELSLFSLFLFQLNSQTAKVQTYSYLSELFLHVQT